MSVVSLHRTLLLDVARTSIAGGMAGGCAAEPEVERWPEALRDPGASFVTLSIRGRLRGCIGSIVPTRPLVTDVWSNARRTAFADPRFPPLAASETAAAMLEISVLSPLEPVAVDGEAALKAVLRPGVDGLILTCGQHRATFLPKVWEKIPDADLFVLHLKRKMGVADDFWHPAMRVERYQTEEFGGPLSA